MQINELVEAFGLLKGARLLKPERSQWHLRFLLERPYYSSQGYPALDYLVGALVNCTDFIYQPLGGERLLSPEDLAVLEPRLDGVGGDGDKLILDCTARDGKPGRISLRARGLLLYAAAGKELKLEDLRRLAADCWGFEPAKTS